MKGWDKFGWDQSGGNGGSSGAVLKSIQTGTISLAGKTSETATINAVDVDNTFILFDGVKTEADGNVYNLIRVELTNSTTITAYANTSHVAAHSVCFTVVEFSSGINNIQAGTITVSGISDTDTITAVDTSKAFVIYLGLTSAKADDTQALYCLTLTNSTTVTAEGTQANGEAVVGYMVVEFE